MSIRTSILLSVIGAGLIFWQAATLPALGGEGDEPAYVGSSKCKMCHRDEYKSWQETKKFKTMDLLKPGNAAESKSKHGLDPAKDYSQDAGCLECHTTGFGKEGGYAVPDAADEQAVKKAMKLAGVGCESCHGPGGSYKDPHKEIKKSKRTYKSEEMLAAGMWKIEEAQCVRCHNEKSPTHEPETNPFVFEKVKKQGGHGMFPLKQRAD